MTERDALKEQLRGIKANNFNVAENISHFTLALRMMDYIGDVDGEMRDDLIYEVFHHWLVGDIFDTGEIHRLLDIALDNNHLFYQLGKRGDSVFTRTFSLLVVALAIYKHRNIPYLSKGEVQNVLSKVEKYLAGEEDVRGYVEGKGWAHGVAHAADVLDELAQCEEIGADQLRAILASIKEKITVNYYAYINEEDERVVWAVKGLLARNIIGEEEISAWIRGFADLRPTGKLPEDNIQHFNTKNFLRSLYFRLIEEAEYAGVINTIQETLQKIRKF